MQHSFEVVGPIQMRKFHLAKTCDADEGHQHHYDHALLVLRGRLKVSYRYEQDGKTVEGESREFGQGESLTVKADVFHTAKALEPDTLYACIFSHHDFDGQVVQTYTGNPRDAAAKGA